MNFNSENVKEERAKNVESTQEQIVSDEEIFEQAKIKAEDIISIPNLIQGIITFAETLGDMHFYPYQKEVVERIIYDLVTDGGNTIAVLFARQTGKSFSMSCLVPSMCILLPLVAQTMELKGIEKHDLLKFRKGLWVGVYGPDYERAGIIGNKINTVLGSKNSKLILSHPEIGMNFPERLNRYIGHLPRGSRINVKSANKRVSIEGDTYHLVITDETQAISDYVLKKSISPFLSSTNGTKVHLGSAYPLKVYFYDVLSLNKREDINRSKKLKCHFDIPYQVAEKYNKNYKKYVEKEKKLLGAHSDEFRMSYENYWPIDKGMLITEDFLVNQLGKDYPTTTYNKKVEHVIGIDIGKIQDPTVITVLEPDWENPIVVDTDSKTVRYVKKIVNWYEIMGDDYDSQYYQICDFLDNYKWSIAVIDATGVGQGMYDRLNNKYSKQNKRVIPFVFTRPDKSLLYSLLARELLAERIIYPNNSAAQRQRKQQKFVSQLLDLSKKIEGGYLNFVPTSDTGHDDYPASLGLAVWGVEGDNIAIDIEEVSVGESFYKVGKMERNFWKN